MVISYDKNIISCASIEEYQRHLILAFSNLDDEIWISEYGKEDELPCIGILINGQDAVINFFSEEINCVSVGNTNREDTINFCNGGYSVCGYQIVSKDIALKCAMDFYETKMCSQDIVWEEL